MSRFFGNDLDKYWITKVGPQWWVHAPVGHLHSGPGAIKFPSGAAAIAAFNRGQK